MVKKLSDGTVWHSKVDKKGKIYHIGNEKKQESKRPNWRVKGQINPQKKKKRVKRTLIRDHGIKTGHGRNPEIQKSKN